MMDNVLSKTKSALNRANSQPQLCESDAGSTVSLFDIGDTDSMVSSISAASSPNGLGPSGLTPEEAKKKALALKNELLEGLDRLSDSLPSNTLDELIDSFGGADNVAEVIPFIAFMPASHHCFIGIDQFINVVADFSP